MTRLLGVVQLLKKEHAGLTRELNRITAALSAFGAAYGNGRPRRISAAGRARIAAAQRARWAKVKGTGNDVVAMAKSRTLSEAGRNKIAAAQRARWAKAKTAKKSASTSKTA